MQAGRDFEARVFDELAAIHSDVVIVDPRLRKPEAVNMTVQAMASQASLILGGWLPDDIDGARTGKPAS